jgi:pyruvate/2-oxoglutarate/acetoin dehydrogenase E1 component
LNIVIDNGLMCYGVSAEILAIISENLKEKNYKIMRVGVADTPIPSTVALAKYSYPNQSSIIKAIEKMLKKKIKIAKAYKASTTYDQPNASFMGPF